MDSITLYSYTVVVLGYNQLPMATDDLPSNLQLPISFQLGFLLTVPLRTRHFPPLLYNKTGIKAAREEKIRQSWIGVMEAKLVREELQKCWRTEGEYLPLFPPSLSHLLERVLMIPEWVRNCRCESL